jgi:hypothetical protein
MASNWIGVNSRKSESSFDFRCRYLSHHYISMKLLNRSLYLPLSTKEQNRPYRSTIDLMSFLETHPLNQHRPQTFSPIRTSSSLSANRSALAFPMSSAAVVFRCVSRPVSQDERPSLRSTRTSQWRILGVLFPPCLHSKGLQKQPKLITTMCELRQEVLGELLSVSQSRCPHQFRGFID